MPKWTKFTTLPAQPHQYIIRKNAIKTIKTNVIGTINILGVAKRVKAKVLQASTSEVYGSALEHPQKEAYWGNVNPIGPKGLLRRGQTLFRVTLYGLSPAKQCGCKNCPNI
jgi:GDP-D-mannose dehydratase